MKKFLKLSWVILMITSLGFSACSDDDEEDDVGNWVTRSDFDGVARSNAASFTIGNSGYVMGGYDGRDRLNDLWQYDSENNYWIQRASFPGEARNSAVAFSIGEKGYVGTGYNGLDYLGDFWEYDPQSDAWTQRADFPGSARFGAVAFSLSNYGFIGCGYDGNHLKDFYRYNPETDSWEQQPFPGSKRVGATAFNLDGNVYLLGGVSNQQYVRDFWMLSGEDFSWVQKRDVANTTDESYDDDYAIVRSYGVAFSINSLGYFTTGTSGSLRTDTWEYNPLTDVWEEKTAFEGAARSGAVAFSIDNRGFVATGASSNYRFDDMYEFFPFEEYDEYD
jgi:N-acetylneuraminic acid mutarotase